MKPEIDRAQLLSGENPRLPSELRFSGKGRYTELVEICIDTAGAVESATSVKSDDPLTRDAVLRVVRDWRFRPFTVDGKPAPFCHVTRFDFTQEPQLP